MPQDTPGTDASIKTAEARLRWSSAAIGHSVFNTTHTESGSDVQQAQEDQHPTDTAHEEESPGLDDSSADGEESACLAALADPLSPKYAENMLDRPANARDCVFAFLVKQSVPYLRGLILTSHEADTHRVTQSGC
jgi:hypothetical protein